MWELGNLQPEGRNSQMISYQAMMPMHQQFHVLVVDHESDCLLNTVKLLELCQYRVTVVGYASAAIQLLSSGKVKFDIAMANTNSPDLHGFKLLQHVVNMDLPIILMSADDSIFAAMRAIENGAFLYMKKPVTVDDVKYLWQHVMRVMRERGKLAPANYTLQGVEIREPITHKGKGVEIREPITHQVKGAEIRELTQQGEGNHIYNNDMSMMKNKEKEKTKKRVRARNESDDYDNDKSNKISKKMCTEWTEELHAKFMDSIQQLGEGKCFPKEILELMNVPGLTRMQVASHLQKCRNENWRSPEERKRNPAPGSGSDGDGKGSSQSKVRRFGSMPRLGKSPLFQMNGVESSSQTRTDAETGGLHDENTGKANHDMENSYVFNHQQLNLGRVIQPGPIRAIPNNISTASSSRRQNSDDLFNFPSMDCLYQNFHGIASQGYNINTNQHHGPYHFHQNSMVPSMDTRSPWNSEKSSFGSDDSNTRAN